MTDEVPRAPRLFAAMFCLEGPDYVIAAPLDHSKRLPSGSSGLFRNDQPKITAFGQDQKEISPARARAFLAKQISFTCRLSCFA